MNEQRCDEMGVRDTQCIMVAGHHQDCLFALQPDDEAMLDNLARVWLNEYICSGIGDVSTTWERWEGIENHYAGGIERFRELFSQALWYGDPRPESVSAQPVEPPPPPPATIAQMWAETASSPVLNDGISDAVIEYLVDHGWTTPDMVNYSEILDHDDDTGQPGVSVATMQALIEIGYALGYQEGAIQMG